MGEPLAESGRETNLQAETLTGQGERMERARLWLVQVLRAMGMAQAQVTVVGDILEIEADSLQESEKAVLLENSTSESEEKGHGQRTNANALDALQYLANTLLNLHQPETEQQAYTIDLQGYRERRLNELQTMAREAVDQVRNTHSEHVFTALSAAERRQMHTFLSDPAFADLETFSRGKEPERHLVIRLANSSEAPLSQEDEG